MKTKRKPPTAAEYNRLQREASGWRQCASQLLRELIAERINDCWDWRSPGIKQYDRLSKSTCLQHFSVGTAGPAVRTRQ